MCGCDVFCGRLIIAVVSGIWPTKEEGRKKKKKKNNESFRCFLLDKISTSLVECERVKAKIGKALRADGSPRMWKKFPPARGQKGFLS